MALFSDASSEEFDSGGSLFSDCGGGLGFFGVGGPIWAFITGEEVSSAGRVSEAGFVDGVGGGPMAVVIVSLKELQRFLCFFFFWCKSLIKCPLELFFCSSFFH